MISVKKEFEITQVLLKKPPLGVMPKIFWVEQRIKDIGDAINRFRKAGKPVPRAFFDEIQELTMKKVQCMVYLIHFSVKYRHSQHYIGFAKDVKKRFEAHKKGQGARLLNV